MTTVIFPPKDPREVLDYGFDWTERMDAGEIITSSTWTLPANTTVALGSIPASYSNNKTVVWFANGTPSETITVSNQITTSKNRTEVATGLLKIQIK